MNSPLHNNPLPLLRYIHSFIFYHPICLNSRSRLLPLRKILNNLPIEIHKHLLNFQYKFIPGSKFLTKVNNIDYPELLNFQSFNIIINRIKTGNCNTLRFTSVLKNKFN